MTQFRDKLKLQNLMIAIGCLILTVISILGATGILAPVAGDVHWIDLWNGFITGASFGILGVMLFSLIRNILALTNEARLKKLYIQASDERTQTIWTKARCTGYQTTLILELVGGIIAGYFSISVSITMICCAVAASFIGLGYVFYYQIKY